MNMWDFEECPLSRGYSVFYCVLFFDGPLKVCTLQPLTDRGVLYQRLQCTN